jgi:DNA-binding response OmpR family regulator
MDALRFTQDGERSSADGQGGTGRVVMIMDDSLTAAEIQDSLAVLGFTIVKTIMNASEAASLSVDPEVALVFVDLELQGSPDVFETGKAIARSQSARVIFLADKDSQVARVEREAPGLGWVKWPFHPIELALEIQIALESGAVGQEDPADAKPRRF